MAKYSIYAVVECGKYLGDVEAASEEDALKSDLIASSDISTCYFSASEIEPKFVKVIAKAL